jgi:hypothetical protein
MLLDHELRAAWKAEAKNGHGPVVGAIKVCLAAAEPGTFDGALYQGANWAKALQACLVAWAATGKPEHAKTAIKFFTALLDDRDKLGDGAGGEKAAQRDDGYAIRNLGPYTALAYDWLHDHSGGRRGSTGTRRGATARATRARTTSPATWWRRR